MKQLTRFQISTDIISAILLFIGVILALIISNNNFLFGYYKNFVNSEFFIGIGPYVLNKSILKWVNDGLMAIFFFLLGLEMKYHMTQGEFQDKKNLLLPFIAAIGGFIIPALVYYFVNKNNAEGIIGWAIPIATDTAFVLAIVSFFGSKISNNCKVFLIGLSIIDDVIAVSILGIFYTPNFDMNHLMLAIIPLTGLFIANITKIRAKIIYIVLSFLLWLFTVKSGIHGTIAGIIASFFIPVTINYKGNKIQLLKEFETSIHTLVAFFVLPLFAFVNCELPFKELSINDLLSPIAIGCFLGLFVGKMLGIFLFSIAAVKLKFCHLPSNVNNTTFFGLSILCGIGFTLSLFIGLQAFDSIILENQMKVGVILSSFVSAVLGTIFIKLGLKQK